jgi:hypothetical protein
MTTSNSISVNPRRREDATGESDAERNDFMMDTKLRLETCGEAPVAAPKICEPAGKQRPFCRTIPSSYGIGGHNLL